VDVVADTALVGAVVAERTLRLGPDLETWVQDGIAALAYLHADGAERRKENRRIDRLEIEMPDVVAGRIGGASPPEAAALVRRQIVLALAAGPAVAVVGVECRAAQMHRQPGRRIR